MLTRFFDRAESFIADGHEKPVHYVVAIVLVLGAFLFRFALHPAAGSGVAFLFLYPAVFLAGWFGGMRPGFAATLLATALAMYFLRTNTGAASGFQIPVAIQVLTFCASCSLFCVLMGMMHHLVTKARKARKEIADQHHWLRQSHVQAEFLAQLTQKLSVVSGSAKLNAIATREIGQFLKAHRCYFFDAHPDIYHARVLTDWCRDSEPSLVGVYALSEFGAPEWWAAVRLGPVSVDDIHTHDLTKSFLKNYEALKIAAYSLSPFIHEGQWKACVSVTSDRPRVWSAEEKTLLENVVARVWPLLERAHIEEELERLVGERTASLQDAVTQMEEFSYSVSHDLRAPLRAMQGYASALLEDYRGRVIDAEAEEYLQRIVTAGLRMDRLTRDVLVYSKIPRTNLQLQPVALDKLVSDIVQQFRQDDSSRAEIVIEAPLFPVMGNESLLSQAISNLVDNAVKFVPPGRVPHVKIWTESNKAKVRLWVEDNGIGIKLEHQKRIWGMFERVHPQTKFEGTGIGLAIVRKTVERMNGAMGVVSDGIDGSKFWIELPGI